MAARVAAPRTCGAAESYVAETVRYAAARGVTLTERSTRNLHKKHGRNGARSHVDKLGAILDAAAILGCDCSQTLAKRRLMRANGDARPVISEMAAQARRRRDKRTARCGVPVPPRGNEARANAYASCGCPRCTAALARQLDRYMAVIVAPWRAWIDRDEALAEASAELLDSIATWPGGGKFTGWFAIRFKRRMQMLHRSTSRRAERTISLNAAAALADDRGGRIVSLEERIRDRTIDVALIVILRDEYSRRALAEHRARIERVEEYESRSSLAADERRGLAAAG